MSFADHFNYPMPSRNETMYLSTLKNEEPALTKQSLGRNRSSNLDTFDIDKAKPHYQGYQYTQKEVFANRNDDIHGSAPKKLHQPLEKVYYNLRNDDIGGSKPQQHKFVTTRGATNPLTPEYVLPQVEIRAASPPKFIRDAISIKDIEGARPNPHTKHNITTKTNNVDDIDGARPRKEWLPQGKQSTLDVRDINYFWEFHTKRQTDPLSPRYKVVDENNKLYEYGQLDNKCAVRHPKDVNKLTSFDLRTQDIDGAQASTSNQHINKLATRNQYMKTQDILGAQAETLKKGITTGRHLDPLWPEYKNPGHTEPNPFYARNTRTGATFASHGAKSVTDFGMKTDFSAPSQLGETVKSAANIESPALQNNASAQVLQTKKSQEAVISPVQTKERRISGEKSPGQVTGGIAARRVISPTSGNEISASKSFATNDEYVPARMPQKPDALETLMKQRPGHTLETKKAQNSNETYQKNVKSFFGMDENGGSNKFKTFSEKLDRFVN